MPVIVIEPEELEQLIRNAVSEEVKAVVASEINRILSTPEDDRLLTRREAMDQLAIRSRDTMLRLEKGGDLPPVHIGTRVHYRLQDVQKIKSGRT